MDPKAAHPLRCLPVTSQEFVRMKSLLNGSGRQAKSFRSTRIQGMTFRNVHEMNWDEVFSDNLSSSCMSLCLHIYLNTTAIGIAASFSLSCSSHLVHVL